MFLLLVKSCKNGVIDFCAKVTKYSPSVIISECKWVGRLRTYTAEKYSLTSVARTE